jgi:hypothetical protein
MRGVGNEPAEARATLRALGPVASGAPALTPSPPAASRLARPSRELPNRSRVGAIVVDRQGMGYSEDRDPEPGGVGPGDRTVTVMCRHSLCSTEGAR